MAFKRRRGRVARREQTPTILLEILVAGCDGAEGEGDRYLQTIGIDQGAIADRRRRFRQMPLVKNRDRP